jgi:PatG Domain
VNQRNDEPEAMDLERADQQNGRSRTLISRTGGGFAPQAGCATCASPAVDGPASAATGAPTFVYAIGRIEARFPNLATEKEFTQAAGRAETKGKTDQETFQAVLSSRENRYLARQVCWVFSVQGLETYLLAPRDPMDLDLLVAAIRPAASPNDIDLIVGIRGPMAPPETCNGLTVPIVIVDQVYSFDRATLIKAIPRPDALPADRFEPAAEEVFNRVMQVAANAGVDDDHRALNYLAVRYPAIYSKAAEQFEQNFSLTGVEVQPSALSSTRNIVEVIFSYTNRASDFTEKLFARVDVTEEFPFMVTKLSPYYAR